jgi:hypothetical protein
VLGDAPNVVLADAKTVAAVKPVGGTIKSAVLVTDPFGVSTVILPDDTDAGTLSVKEVAVAAVSWAG